MSAHDSDLAKRAKDERDGWKRVRAKSVFSAAAVGAVGLAGAPVAIVVVPALVAAGLILNAELKVIGAERKVEDPPRVDFLTPTVVMPVIPFRDVFGDSAIERSAALLFGTLVDAVATEEAMVLADERQQGAERFGALEVARLRRLEHAQLARTAGRLNANLEQLSRLLSQQTRAYELPTLAKIRPSRGDLLTEYLPREVTATLARAGYPVEALATTVGRPGAITKHLEEMSDALEAAGEASGAYGRALLRRFPGDDDPDGGTTAPLGPSPSRPPGLGSPPEFDPLIALPATTAPRGTRRRVIGRGD